MTVDRNRAIGCLVGLAVGDAVGTTLEFKRRGSFKPITDMIGGGPFDLEPGQWTDDTSMALCLAESLIEKRDFDPIDQLQRYVRWHTEGHLSSTGTCFDIGGTIYGALQDFRDTGQPYCGATEEETAGNGSLMRLAPIPLFYLTDPEKAIHNSGESSRTTHQAPQAIDACRYFGGLLVSAVNGATKDELLEPRHASIEGYWTNNDLDPRVAAVADGSYKNKAEDELDNSGYVVATLESALWAFHTTDNYRDAVLAAVNLGGDADTIGTVCGQIAGAHYGLDAIPSDWVEKLALRDQIIQFAEKLLPQS